MGSHLLGGPRRGPTIVNAVVYDRVIERAEKVYPLEGGVLALVADNPGQRGGSGEKQRLKRIGQG